MCFGVADGQAYKKLIDLYERHHDDCEPHPGETHTELTVEIAQLAATGYVRTKPSDYLTAIKLLENVVRLSGPRFPLLCRMNVTIFDEAIILVIMP